jgi:hypothetical protein
METSIEDRSKSRLLSTVLAVGLGWLLLTTPFAVQAQFNYTTNNGTITITGYTSTNGVVVIPETVAGLSVTAIGKDAFLWDTNITSVILPKYLLNPI